MELSAWCEKDKIFVRLCGEIDHHAVKDARNEVDDILIKNRPSSLILDLSSIDFMDSSGLGFVLGRLRRMKDLNGRLYILNPAPRVTEMLSMAGVDKLCEIIKAEKEGQQ